jgi:Domain of unknown function (DUF3786)
MLDKREEALIPFIEEARISLSEVDPRQIAARSGVKFDTVEQLFHLRFLKWAFTVSYPGFIVRAASPQQTEGSPWLHAVILYYFSLADGTPVKGEWISLRQIPDGLLYDQAFQGYAPDKLAAGIGNDLDRFEKNAEWLGGKAEDMGDAAYSFLVFPRVPLAVAYWLGDEEFPPAANVLFHSSSIHYLPTFALANVGLRTCLLLMKGSGQIK